MRIYKPLLGIKGSYSLDRYELEWGGTWICYDMNEARKFITDPVELRKVQLRDETIFLRCPRMITRQDSVSLRGTVDIDCYYHTNSIHSTFITADESPYDLYFLLALMNSKLFSYYHLSLALKGPDLHPQVLATNIPKLPVRRINFTTPQAEQERLATVGKGLYLEYLKSKDWSKVLAFIDACLPQGADGSPDIKREKSDVVHDLLAFLAEEMTRLNKEKQSEIRGFLTWLEKEVIKTPIEDQKNKTKIKEFYESDSDSLLDILKKNKVIDDPHPSNKRNTFVKEFTDAVNVINPLRDKIRLTDELIDQTVYKLYGLTEEEIAVVEGRS